MQIQRSTSSLTIPWRASGRAARETWSDGSPQHNGFQPGCKCWEVIRTCRFRSLVLYGRSQHALSGFSEQLVKTLNSGHQGGYFRVQAVFWTVRAISTRPMATAFLSFLLAAPPDLSELERFPTLDAAEAQIGALIRVRYALMQAPPSKAQGEALRYNASQLLAWELLLEAWGGLDEEEGRSDDEEMCRRALGRLMKLLARRRLEGRKDALKGEHDDRLLLL